MESENYEALDKAIGECESVDISVKIKRNADVMHKKLGQELKINQFLMEKDHHENYKDIRNDMHRINMLITEAEEQSIDLDTDLVAKVNGFTSRLISERNLRKQRDLYLEGISECNPGQVEKLQNLINDAEKKKVEEEYIKHASKLTSQMSGNIKARDTL